jgi:hypothetical protein
LVSERRFEAASGSRDGSAGAGLASAQQVVWNEVSNAQTKLTRKIDDNVVLEEYATSLEMTLSGKATTKESVKAFLAVKKDTTGRGQQVSDRMQSIVVDGKSIVFSETRDKQADSSWVHRSYFAK